MATKPKRPSPILGTAAAMIHEASDSLITDRSKFRHSFEIEISQVSADPDQPRRHFDESELRNLASSLQQQGQLQPILVRRDPVNRGDWVIVAGERRWRAARIAGWTTILAIEHVDDPSIATLIENLQRTDLNPVEEARGIRRLIEQRGWTQSDAAQALSKSKAEVSASLGILSLPDAFLQRVLTSELSLPKNVLVELARVAEPGSQLGLVQLAERGELTVAVIRSARESEERHNGSARESTRSVPTLSFKLVEKIRSTIAARRQGGEPLNDEERQKLEALRLEIEGLLKAK